MGFRFLTLSGPKGDETRFELAFGGMGDTLVVDGIDGTAFVVEDGETPAAFGTGVADVLSTDIAPYNVIIGEDRPRPVDLGRTTKGKGVKITEYFETDFLWEDGEGVETDEGVKLLGEIGELAEATHCEDSLEDRGSSRVGRGGKSGPDTADSLSVR